MTSRGSATGSLGRSAGAEPVVSAEQAADALAGGVLVVGAGLIGTSLGMALTDAGVPVQITDLSSPAARMAGELGAGSEGEGHGLTHAVLAVPPGAIAGVLARLSRLHPLMTFSDVGSVKATPQVEAEALGVDVTRFCGAHPIAGRERSGPIAARVDLFAGMPWVLCPGPTTSAEALGHAQAVAVLAGAATTTLSPAAHDEALALVSHLPQVVASLLSARLLEAPATVLALSGRGLADTTRIAASDPGLWREVLSLNAAGMLPLLDDLAADLQTLRAALADSPRAGAAAAEDLLRRGNAGHDRLPGKRGARGPAFREVPVLLDDSPGQLGRVLLDASDLGVNVEDLMMEHAPGRPVGVLVLAVRPEQEAALRDGLTARGWPVRDVPT